MTIRLSNPRRGCGTKKKGGFYLEGASSPNGRLRRWSWLLGMGTERCGRANYYANIPPRSHAMGSLMGTTLTFTPVAIFNPAHVADNVPPAIERRILDGFLQGPAIFDHVGARYYPDPYLFFKEVVEHGPSRRVTPELATAVAPHTPLPVIFSHAGIPVVAERAIAEALAWSRAQVGTPHIPWCQPTPWMPNWGLYSDNLGGGNHWLADLMEALSLNGFYQSGSCSVPPFLTENILTTEQLYGVSWITRVTYVINDDDPPELLDTIASKGIVLGEI